MKYKIIVDSSSNLLSNYIKDDEIGFEVVPLTIRVGDNVFIDNDLLNIDKMLEVMEKSSSKSTSACPSPFEFENSIKEASNSIIITISSKLSGCYNSAVLASKSFENTDKNVLVLDSKATAGTMILLVDKAYELMKKDIPWDEFVKTMNEYRDSLELLFVLNKYDNLVKNGRMSKAVAFIAIALIAVLALIALFIFASRFFGMHYMLYNLDDIIEGIFQLVIVVAVIGFGAVFAKKVIEKL